MKIQIIGATQNLLNNADSRQDTPFEFCAKTMATCVSNDPIQKMTTETLEATQKRLETTLKERHHSGFDMFKLILQIDDVSKIFCTYLNSLHCYDTEETSGRHAKLTLPPKEQAVFDYFYDKFYNYACEKYPDAKKHKKQSIALENARMVAGVDAKTNITHSISLRQLNYIYEWAQKLLEKQNPNPYEQAVMPDMREFCEKVAELKIGNEPLINPKLADPYRREFNLFGNTNLPEIYGDVYAINYQASFPGMAQSIRHRSIKHVLSVPSEKTYYIPPIVQELELEEEWTGKIEELGNLAQAQMLNVRESGQLDAFMMKIKERCCPHAQEEIYNLTHENLAKIANNLEYVDYQLSQIVQRYVGKDRRSFHDYQCICSTPCKPRKIDEITR